MHASRIWRFSGSCVHLRASVSFSTTLLPVDPDCIRARASWKRVAAWDSDILSIKLSRSLCDSLDLTLLFSAFSRSIA